MIGVNKSSMKIQSMEIQRRIIGSVLDQGQYEKVKWLTKKDFRNYENKPYQDVWEIIRKYGGDYREIWRNSLELSGFMNQVATTSDLINIQRLGIILVEWNVHSLVEATLMDIMNNSSNENEFDFVNNLWKEWLEMISKKGGDILSGVAAMPDLVKPHVFDGSYYKIKSMSIKVEKRVLTIKKLWHK